MSCKQEVVPAAGLYQHNFNFLLRPPHLPACNLVTNTKHPDGEVAGGYEGSPASLHLLFLYIIFHWKPALKLWFKLEATPACVAFV